MPASFGAISTLLYELGFIQVMIRILKNTGPLDDFRIFEGHYKTVFLVYNCQYSNCYCWHAIRFSDELKFDGVKHFCRQGDHLLGA